MRNGRELFFRNGDKIMVVEVSATPSSFSAGKSRVLFEGLGQSLDVAPDGQHFLMIQPVEPEQPPKQIHVVLNWSEELKRKVPVK